RTPGPALPERRTRVPRLVETGQARPCGSSVCRQQYAPCEVFPCRLGRVWTPSSDALKCSYEVSDEQPGSGDRWPLDPGRQYAPALSDVLESTVVVATGHGTSRALIPPLFIPLPCRCGTTARPGGRLSRRRGTVPPPSSARIPRGRRGAARWAHRIRRRRVPRRDRRAS